MPAAETDTEVDSQALLAGRRHPHPVLPLLQPVLLALDAAVDSWLQCEPEVDPYDSAAQEQAEAALLLRVQGLLQQRAALVECLGAKELDLERFLIHWHWPGAGRSSDGLDEPRSPVSLFKSVWRWLRCLLTSPAQKR